MTGADIIALNKQRGREARRRMRDFVDAAAAATLNRPSIRATSGSWPAGMSRHGVSR